MLTRRKAAAAGVIFLLAFCVRALYWQDHQVDIVRNGAWINGLVNLYRAEALRITDEGGILIPNRIPPSGDAKMVIHPPGYSFLLIGLHNIKSYGTVRLAQVFADSLAAVFVFLISEELFGFAAGIAAGCLVGLSPHLAIHSLWLTPDSLAALPTLLAVWFLIKGMRDLRYGPFIIAGCMIGLSCWLRSNALLLAPFLSVILWLLLGRRGIRFAAALSAAALILAAPLTIRNYVIYHRFIPTSIGNGITLIEGIADYDRAGRFGMPRSDDQVLIKDSEWYNRPDYAQSLWEPDGVDRDRERFSRGVAVIRSHPFWFLSVMARRVWFMLGYDSRGSHEWPFVSANAPFVSKEPTFGHNASYTPGGEPAVELSPDQFFQSGVRAKASDVRLSADQRTLTVAGGSGSNYEAQFASRPIPVKKRTDYLLDIQVGLESGGAAVSVMDADQHVALASYVVPGADELKAAARSGDRAELAPTIASDTADTPTLHIVFSSGLEDSVRIVIGDNGAAAGPPIVKIRECLLYEYGPTPYFWDRYARGPLRLVQKHVFVTGIMLPLVLIGAFLLVTVADKRTMAVLLAVPAYYLISQSAFHTEYRYILPIHYFLFIFASLTLCGGASVAAEVAQRAAKGAKKWFAERRTRTAPITPGSGG